MSLRIMFFPNRFSANKFFHDLQIVGEKKAEDVNLSQGGVAIINSTLSGTVEVRDAIVVINSTLQKDVHSRLGDIEARESVFQGEVKAHGDLCLEQSSASRVQSSMKTVRAINCQIVDLEAGEGADLTSCQVEQVVSCMGSVRAKNSQFKTIRAYDDIVLEGGAVSDYCSAQGIFEAVDADCQDVSACLGAKLERCTIRKLSVMRGICDALESHFKELEARNKAVLRNSSAKTIVVSKGSLHIENDTILNYETLRAKELITLSNADVGKVESLQSSVQASNCRLGIVEAREGVDIRRSEVDSLIVHIDPLTPCRLFLQGSVVKEKLIIIGDHPSLHRACRSYDSLDGTLTVIGPNYSLGKIEEVAKVLRETLGPIHNLHSVTFQDGQYRIVEGRLSVVQDPLRKIEVPFAEPPPSLIVSVTVEIVGGHIEGEVCFQGCDGRVLFLTEECSVVEAEGLGEGADVEA